MTTKNIVLLIGPLTEVHLPVDSLTKRVKGFAFITFMMPENAVQAYTALDGTSFQVGNSNVNLQLILLLHCYSL